MLRGLPASGKSTLAEEMCKEKLVARVNRDLLREMFNYGTYSGKNEKTIVSSEMMLVKHLLNNGMEHVIIDDCNLNPQNKDMWKNLAVLLGVEFEVLEVKTDVGECMARDKARDNSVGRIVIRDMAIQYGLIKIDKPVVVCDIDGTIADCKHRLHHLKGEKKDWDGFFGDMHKDTLRTEVHEMLVEHEKDGKQIIFVSARPSNYRAVTEAWLLENVDIKSPLMVLMRRSDDSRDDTIVKNEIYNKYLSKMDIRAVIDDRPKVLRMWKELGLETVDVGEGVEF